MGLLDTRLPDGSSGFSFLIIVSVDLPPIQIGFGFTLNGVGGLAGIHRTVMTEVLRQGLVRGTLDHIMFPRDPVRNAPQIISDLRAVFPPMTGRFVFGPMLKLGWGVPSLITANIGVVLELPDPFRLLILGQTKVEIPAPEAAIVSLKLDVLGVIDFEERLFSIDATLYDSRVATFSVYGDMAMRLFWGEPPNFALAIGGLHPQFRPPPNFPTLRRATIEIGLGGNPRLTCQSYLAVTSNSLQTGAKIELYASAGSFNIHGWLGYDALLIFRPLSFQVDIDAGVELRRNTSVIAGIHVHATLSGLGPWHVKGKACLSLLFFDICVPFRLTVGSALDQVLPSVNPLLQLVAALQDPRSWVSGLPPSAFRAVSFATPPGSTLTLIDPVGSLSVQQKVLPLNRTLTKFGEAALVGPDRYDVSWRARRCQWRGVHADARLLRGGSVPAVERRREALARRLREDGRRRRDRRQHRDERHRTRGTGRVRDDHHRRAGGLRGAVHEVPDAKRRRVLAIGIVTAGALGAGLQRPSHGQQSDALRAACRREDPGRARRRAVRGREHR